MLLLSILRGNCVLGPVSLLQTSVEKIGSTVVCKLGLNRYIQTNAFWCSTYKKNYTMIYFLRDRAMTEFSSM